MTSRPIRLPVVRLAVMCLLAAGATLVHAQDLPRPRGFVNDFANVISAADARSMEQIITELRDRTRAEIAVVTVSSYEPYGSIDEYAIALAEQWGVGSAADDAGVILLLAMDERRVRIEVGYGLEGAIPDGRAGSLLDRYVLPELRAGRYSAGLLNGTAAIAQAVADEYGVSLAGVRAEPRAAQPAGPDISDLVYVVFVLLLIGGRWFFWPLLFVGRRRGFYGGGFGSSSRGGGSSFGGFGGGGFGGGGASRGF